MYLYLLLVFSAAGAIAALVNWRLGVLLMIGLAALQDPLRKMVPGTPGYLALVTAPIFFALAARALSTTPGWWRQFELHFPKIAKPLALFILLCMPAAAISLTYGQGSWMLTLLGVFSYSVIFLAVIVGFNFAKRGVDVRALLAWYCGVHGVMLMGGYLEYFGWFSGWLMLSDKAMGFEWVRHQQGYVVKFIAGFYRSGDVMGWHAAAVACLSVVLAMSSVGRRRWLWYGISIMAVGALLMCGRRKMVFMLPVFLVALGWLYWQANRPARVLSLLILLSIPSASIMLIASEFSEDLTAIRYYRETAGEAVDSLQSHGIESVLVTVRQNGFFGAGLGVATPGSQHLKVERPRAWQESAPSRVVAELGILGATGLMLVILGIVLTCWRCTRLALVHRSPYAIYSAGLFAFFISNVGSLTVSGQILADPFIAAFLGLMVGVALSIVRLPPDPYQSRLAVRTVATPAEAGGREGTAWR